jgi:hypothetical protein
MTIIRLDSRDAAKLRTPGADRQTAAEATALAALGWIAEDAERLGQFLAASGLAPTTLRNALREPGTLGAVLDFVLEDEARLLAFAAAHSLPPEAPMRARRDLPGGPVDEW